MAVLSQAEGTQLDVLQRGDNTKRACGQKHPASGDGCKRYVAQLRHAIERRARSANRTFCLTPNPRGKVMRAGHGE